MDIKEFIGKEAKFDDGGSGYIWGIQKNGGLQMIGEVRGWGAIQNLFKNQDGSIDVAASAKFQVHLGTFIADAINEKLNNKGYTEAIQELWNWKHKDDTALHNHLITIIREKNLIIND